MMRIHNRQTTNTTGMTLLEVLISVMLLSIGLLGALRLHMHALLTMRQSAYLGSALDLANELATTMREHNKHTRADGSGLFLHIDYRADRDPLPHAGSCLARDCPAADIAHWLHNIAQQLPRVRAVVCQDDSSWDSKQQRLRWECSPSPAGSGVNPVIKLGWTDNSELPESPPRIAVLVLPETN